ncbi:MAG TPA: DoxX family protein [Flavisolibacter sp.]|nr:DoxX family protein [Flavisolibacter sp.]
MIKRNQIIYWVATGWLALGMASTGIVQLLHMEEELDSMRQLGYPVYFLTILGAWKLLGVAAVLLPRLPLLKEWAYAGFFFAMSGAILSRLLAGDGAAAVLPSMLLLVLACLSWYYRPADRRLASPRQSNGTAQLNADIA